MLQDGLYSELRPDLQLLIEPLFAMSECTLRKQGGFLPRGAVLTVANEVRLGMALPDPSKLTASADEVLPFLHRALRCEIAEDNHNAVAVAEDVLLLLDDNRESPAMKVLVEHRRGLCVAFYVPYSRSLSGDYSFQPMFAKPAEPEVRGWPT